MRARCRADWMQTLLESMLLSNQETAKLAEEFDLAAVTDITGFGLAGHLLEMLRASEMACELQLGQIPLLPGAAELIEQGVESTLAPANRGAELEIGVGEAARSQPGYQALFDPQTCGGMLLAVPPHVLPALLERLPQRQPAMVPSVIGVVRQRQPGQPRIILAANKADAGAPLTPRLAGGGV
jgi:selenide,water dikinase